MIRWALGGSLSLAILAACVACAACVWLYRRELRFAPERAWVWILPVLRVTAICLIALTLAQPQVESRWQTQPPGRVAFLLDASQSMTLVDGEAGVLGSRFDRSAAVTRDIKGPWQSIFAEAATTVFRSGDEGILRLRELTPLMAAEYAGGQAVAGSDDRIGPQESWTPEPFTTQSSIGQQLLDVAATLQEASGAPRSASGQNAAAQRAAIVLLSDGVSNSGAPISGAAAKLAEFGIAVYPIGYGAVEQPSDLIAASVVAPQSVFRTARVAGTFVFMDYVDEEVVAQVEILSGENVLWSSNIQCAGIGQRSVEFSFPAADLLADVDSDATTHTAALVASIRPRSEGDAIEATLENNTQEFLINVETNISRVMIIDGHSRWETRYLKNLFQRDPTWDIKATITGNDQAEEPFSSPNDLSDIDLVIVGDVPHAFLPDQRQQWLKEFVSRGGGLVVVDGAAAHLRAPDYSGLHELLPIEWPASDLSTGSASLLQTHAQLEPAGLALPALNLIESQIQQSELVGTDANATFWQSLPELKFVATSRAKLESEVLASAASSVEKAPLLVTQRYGAGRVLYVASDQTWRWRYKSADAIHGRLWNQLARWVARKQSRVENDFLSLDSSLAFARQGTPVELVCELRNTNETSAELVDVIAKISDAEGRVIRRLRLPKSEPTRFRSTVDDLPAGELTVTVEVEGYSSTALDVRLPLLITDRETNEMQVVTCAETQLQELARVTGGEYLHEREANLLPERLVAFRGSSVQSSIFQVWSSYYWFAAALVLLAIEWLLRKRFGLI